MIESPYLDDPSASWLRGNLHTHTVESYDCARPVSTVIDDYELRGYDFLVFTDHDAFVDPTDHRDTTTMTLVGGTEVTDGGRHVLAVGVDGPVEPHGDRQAVLDTIYNTGGLALLPHPNWGESYDHYPQTTLRELSGYAGIEIYNGASRRGRGAPTATDQWDRLLSSGHAVWGYGTDDTHRDTDVGVAWTVVQTTDRTPNAVLAALAAGRCYVSTGVTIETIESSARTITVETADAEAIRLVADHGTVHRTVDAAAATFNLDRDLRADTNATYVRIECFGAGDQMAWTQPCFLDTSSG